MFISIGKQSGECVESVLKKKRKATVGRICRKGFKHIVFLFVYIVVRIS